MEGMILYTYYTESVMRKIIFSLIISVSFFALITAAAADDDIFASVDRAQQLLDENRYLKAIKIYRIHCKKGSTAECWNQLGVAYMCIKEHKSAAECFNRAIKVKTNSSRYHSNLALAHFYLKNTESARRLYRAAMNYDPYNLNARINYGVFLSALKEYKAAEKVLADVLKIDRGLFFAHLHLGYIYISTKRPVKAIKAFSEGIKANPRSENLYIYRAKAYIMVKDLGAAERDLNSAEEIHPSNPKVNILRSIIERRRLKRY